MAAFGITFPAHTKEIIDEIRYTIGRNITIHVNVSGVPCTLCSLDPVTNLSTDPFCTGCNGAYWINTTSAWVCSAHVRWRRADQPLWSPGGIIETGDCKITIAHSGNALQNVKDSRYFEVDGHELYMKSYTLKGVQQLNRIAIVLTEDPADI